MWGPLLASPSPFLVLKVRYLPVWLKGTTHHWWHQGCSFSLLILPIYGRRDSRHPSAYLSPCTLTNIENTFLGCREEKADCTAGSLRFYHLNNSLRESFMVLPQSGCQRQGRERASGQAWRGRRRGEAVLPLLQLRLALLAPLSPCQTG